MYKRILYGSDARGKIMEGVHAIVKLIAVTLGPNGRNILISRGDVVDYGFRARPLHVTKDGITCAHAFDVSDEMQRVGVLAVKEASARTVEAAGDGTTTTAVLFRAIAEEGMKAVEAGANPIQLKRGIDKAVEYVVGELKKVAIPVKGDLAKVRQIATISANNDSSIGDMIADAYAKIGEEGVIDIVETTNAKTEIKIADGYKFDRTFVHPQFVVNKAKWVTEYENPLILLYEKRITHHTKIEPALRISLDQNRPLLIICEDVTDEGLAFLLMNKERGAIQVCAVAAPEFGEERRLAMEDIAAATGATFLSDTKGTKIENIQLAHLGTAKRILVNKDETVIIGGGGKKEKIDFLLNELRDQLKEAKEEDKAPLQKRIAKLTGGVAMIEVGGSSGTEVREKYDRFDDSVRAVRSAFEEGFVAGAGTAFLKLTMPTSLDEGVFAGYDVIFKSLKAPLTQICENSGVDSLPIVVDVADSDWDIGYNAKTGNIENLIESGVIDPAKVLRCSLENAASAAGMILTADGIIVDSVNP